MTVHREEGGFVVRIELAADFAADYEGDDDGYVWLEGWRERVQPRVVRAIYDALRADPRFSAVPFSRGKSPSAEIEIAVRYHASAAKHG